ncbi:MAG TPA: hypothetical protein VMH30_08630 [Verrucomicrobiae bacterium]|nr:hypothetical protein [Verrucomicrobiae bacterium]
MATESSPLMTEARARIIWGDSPASVRDFLASNGISGADADAKIKEFSAERNATIRQMAIRNVLIGAGLTVAAFVGLPLIFAHPDIIRASVNYRGGGVIIGSLIFAGVYGLWKLVNGIIDLVRPQSEMGSIPDMTDE